MLAEHFQRDAAEIVCALHALQDYHGVVLHPHNSEVWVIHPFATAPTNFLLRQGHREWWVNCAWCSLGAAALLGGDITITTTLGANGRQVTLRIEDGKLLDNEYYVHFPVPMVDVWDNVIFTCSTMLLFESEAAVTDWSGRHNIPLGDIQPVDKIFDLASTWYGRHLDTDWEKWTLEEARAIFARFELTGPIWDLPEAEGTF